ncbi:MAG: Glutathione S-transferase domain protein [Verrucomicrobiaceae bacterium]|nr:Glutathione S-transferase domain protein [Verrucomicrobiaceae bacterium]
MITIHHLLVSQSERVIWLMEELQLAYELKSYPRNPETRLADPIFLQLHPLGTAPVIQDGAITLGESSAIFTYVLDLYGEGKLRIAPGQPNYADFIYWFHYANAGLMPQAMQYLFGAMAGDDSSNPRAAWARERFARHLAMINDRLANNAYVAGEFTAADILLHFPFGTMSSFAPVDISGYPHIRAWLDRLSARPAYQKAMKLAGHTQDPAQPSKKL